MEHKIKHTMSSITWLLSCALSCALSVFLFNRTSKFLHKRGVSGEIISSILSLCNGVLIVPLTFCTFYLHYFYQPAKHNDLATQVENVLLMFQVISIITKGYLLVDSYALLTEENFSKDERRAYLLHHALGIAMIIIVNLANPCLIELALYTLLTECSSIFSNIRVILSYLNKKGKDCKNGKCVKIPEWVINTNGICMTVTHVATRLVGVPVALVRSRECILFGQGEGIAGMLWSTFICVVYFLFTKLNLFWGGKMINGIIRKFIMRPRLHSVLPPSSSPPSPSLSSFPSPSS